MDFRCKSSDILRGVSLISNICQSKTTKPILQDIKMVIEDNQLTLIGTDLEVAIKYCIYEVESSEPGVVVIPAIKLLNILREITSEEVSFNSEQRVCNIRSADGKFKLISDDPDEFPLVPDHDFGNAMSINAGSFIRYANTTLFAVAKDMSCYAYNGVLLEIYENGIKFVGTDGRRLAIAGDIDPTQENMIASSVIQVKGITQVLKSIDDKEADLLIKVFKNQFIIKIGHIEIASRLLEGDFPKYRDVIPSDNNTIFIIEKEDLYSALRKVAITAGSEVRAVQFNFMPGILKLYSQQEGIGESEVELPIEYDGDGFEISFNPDFITDYLKVYEKDTLSLCFKDENSSCLMKDSDKELYIVMPITSQ